jgi:very-short-patch-repair endonuclease
MRAPEKTFSRARALRRQMSLPEVVLWQALRKGRLSGLRLRRQHPIGPYILDFYCPSARLAIEVDGFAHDTAAAARNDERRQAWLAGRGVTVLRFRADEVLHDEKLQSVLVAIERAAAAAPSGALGAPPPPPGGGGTRIASA